MTSETDYEHYGSSIISHIQDTYRQQIIDQAQAEVDRQTALELQAEPEAILAVEALSLAAQMRQLYRGRIMGRTLCRPKISIWGNTLMTEPILGFNAGSIELGDAMPDANIAVGYKFQTPKEGTLGRHQDKLTMITEEKDLKSEFSAETDTREIVIDSSGNVPKVTIDADMVGFKKFMAGQSTYIKLMHQYPWLKNYNMDVSANGRVNFERHIVMPGFDIIELTGPGYVDEPPQHVVYNILDELHEEVRIDLPWKAGDNEPTLFLIGQVMAARKTLAKRQILSKLLK